VWLRRSKELFYQQALRLFSNTLNFELDPPLPLVDLVVQGLEASDGRAAQPSTAQVCPLWRRSVVVSHRAVAPCCRGHSVLQRRAVAPLRCVQGIVSLLLEKGPMLLEYFGIGVEDSAEAGARLVCLPRLLDGHTPCFDALPDFLVNLARSVKWTEEAPCFHTVSLALADFYSQLPASDDDAADGSAAPAASLAVAAAGDGAGTDAGARAGLGAGSGAGTGPGPAATPSSTCSATAAPRKQVSWIIRQVGPQRS
jgi:hypothetical protein